MFKLNILRLIYRKEPPYYFFRGTNVHKYCQAGVDCTYQNNFPSFATSDTYKS